SASARGSRLNVWNTNPISLLRIRASSSSARSLTFWPFSQYSPLVGVSRQPMRFISVDLPDPDGPITATYSFLRICTLTPRSARTSSEPMRSEEHTSELQSLRHLVCRLLLEKKKATQQEAKFRRTLA